MFGMRHSSPKARVLIISAGLVEFIIGVCLLAEVHHDTLGQLHIALASITLLGVTEMFGHQH